MMLTMFLCVLVCLFSVLLSLCVLGLCVKLYTEYMKDKSINAAKKDSAMKN